MIHRATIRLAGDLDSLHALMSYAMKRGILVEYRNDDDEPTPAPVGNAPTITLARPPQPQRERKPRVPAPFVPDDRVEALYSDTRYEVTGGRHGTVVSVNVPRTGSVCVRWDGEDRPRQVRASLLKLYEGNDAA